MAGKETIIECLQEHVEKRGGALYMTQPMGGGAGEIKTWTFQEAWEEATRMAAFLKAKDLPPGSSIALCSKNCAWWIMADLAIWLAGHVSVPIYPTLTADTTQFILEHSEAKLLFVGKLDKHPWDEMKKGVPASMPTVSFPLCPGAEGDYGDTWADITAKTEPLPLKEIANRKPEEMATIIYTSGSTGRPKGVMISFKTMKVTTNGIVKLLKATSKDRELSYLPLAHGMARWTDECIPWVTGGQIFFADSLATFVEDLNRCKPTLFLSVPRLWTKFQMGVNKKMPPKKLDKLLKIPILGYFVKRKILKGLGLDSVRFAGSGSAPMPAELIAWYHRLGLELLEGYGMTEDFNYSHISRPGKSKHGTVGEPYDDVEHRIASDGEIQVKTPGLMMGYYKNPEATKETLTEDGWLRTGDRGEIDSQNRLTITGRTKELFKTSKGKYVAPAPIENKLIVHARVELACVGGSGYPQPHAILQLSPDTKAEIEKSADVKAAVEAELEALLKQVNPTLDAHEHLQFLAIVKDEWLPENGFLTPTQKIVRRKIEEAYDPNNDEWYDSKKKVLWFGW